MTHVKNEREYEKTKNYVYMKSLRYYIIVE